MRRLAWSQLRFRTARVIALLAGMLLATTAFTVLTAAARTSQLRTVGTVSAHFVPAYDILVRPVGARTRLETRTGTVQPNFLSGIYGGITMAQYHQIQQIPGVQVAAPIAMIGYSLLFSGEFGAPIPAADYARPGRQLYRMSTTWVSEAGSSRITQPGSYIYVTPNRLKNISSRHVCPPQLATSPDDQFGVAAQSSCEAWSKVNGDGTDSPRGTASNPEFGTTWVLPVLIAAVDPVAEAKLDGLNHAVISGSYLAENATERPNADGADTGFPVLAASTSGVDEYAVTQLQLLATPPGPPKMNVSWMTREDALPGRTIATTRSTAQQAYQDLLGFLRRRSILHTNVWGYWSVGPASYRRGTGGALTPLSVHNPPSVWFITDGLPAASVDNEDNQYRVLTEHAPHSSVVASGPSSPQLVGIFDPAKIRSFDPLSRVPLGAYQPVAAVPATAASRKALHGQDLLPNQNLGGYVSQPVDLITILSALPALEDPGYYGTNLPVSDPISVIRVRVAGVTGPNAVSLSGSGKSHSRLPCTRTWMST